MPFLAAGTHKPVHGGRAGLSSAAGKAQPAMRRDASQLSEHSAPCQLFRAL